RDLSVCRAADQRRAGRWRILLMAYRLKYSDYVTSEGPPDPLRWIGPPGPQGEPGKDGEGALVGATPPGNVPSPLWWDSNSGQLFVQYDDGTSVQWVSANSIDASTLEGSFLPLTGGSLSGNVEALRASFGTQAGAPACFDGSTPLTVMNNPTFSTTTASTVYVNGQYSGASTATSQIAWNL